MTVRIDASGAFVYLRFGPGNGPKAEVRIDEQLSTAVAADDNEASPTDSGGNQPNMTFFRVERVLVTNNPPASLESD
jgi:hypothetical protein